MIAKKEKHYCGNWWNLNIKVDIIILDIWDVWHTTWLGRFGWYWGVSAYIQMADEKNSEIESYDNYIH